MPQYPVKIAIIGGSGLDDPDIFKNRSEKSVSTPFGCPSDALVIGKINDVDVILLSRHDRRHSVNPTNVNYRANIWALKQEGVTHIIATNACGSLQEEHKPGDLILVDNFIDRTTRREQTFYDGVIMQGVCHLPMEPPYSEPLRDVIIQVAKKTNIAIKEKGVIVVIEGPRFSSKAESMVFKSWGGDCINMTAVPEVVLAKEAGIHYSAIALITDYDCWRDTGTKVSVAEVLKNFAENCSKLTSLIPHIVSAILARDWDAEIKELRDLPENSMQHKK